MIVDSTFFGIFLYKFLLSQFFVDEIDDFSSGEGQIHFLHSLFDLESYRLQFFVIAWH